MQSKIEIINLALAKLADGNSIQSLSENSPEAQQAAAHYDIAAQCILTEHSWDFAKKTARMALLPDDTAITAWAYHYAYPADGVHVCRVYPASAPAKSAPFRIGQALTGNQRAVMTNQEDAVAEYILADPLVANMPPQFVNALSWRLAAEIALAIGRPGAGEMLQAYSMQLEEAKLRDAREAGPRSRTDGNWPKSRYPQARQQASGEGQA